QAWRGARAVICRTHPSEELWPRSAEVVILIIYDVRMILSLAFRLIADDKCIQKKYGSLKVWQFTLPSARTSRLHIPRPGGAPPPCLRRCITPVAEAANHVAPFRATDQLQPGSRRPDGGPDWPSRHARSPQQSRHPCAAQFRSRDNAINPS